MLLILFTPSQLLLSDSISLLQEYNTLAVTFSPTNQQFNLF